MSHREDLKAYLDGELAETRARELEQALKADPFLRQEAEELSAVTAAFKAMPQPAPHGIERTLEALTRAQRAPVRRPLGYWLGVSLAGAAALTLAGAIFFPVFAQSKAAAKRAVFADKSAESANIMARAMPDLPATTSVEDGMEKQISTGAAPAIVPPPAPVGKEKFALKDQDEKRAYSKPKGVQEHAVADEGKKPQSRAEPAAEIAATPNPPTPAGGGMAGAQTAKPEPEPLEIKVPSLAVGRAALETLAQEFGGTMEELPAKEDNTKMALAIDVSSGQEQRLIARLKELAKELKENPEKYQSRTRDQSVAADFAVTKRTAAKSELAKNRKRVPVILVPES